MLKSNYFVACSIALALTACGKSVSKNGEPETFSSSPQTSSVSNRCEVAKSQTQYELQTLKSLAQDSLTRASQLIRAYYAALETVDGGKNDRRRSLIACYGDDLSEGKFNYDHRDVKAELERNKRDYFEAHFKTVAEPYASIIASMRGEESETGVFEYGDVKDATIASKNGAEDLRTDFVLMGDFRSIKTVDIIPEEKDLARFDVTYVALDKTTQEPAVRASYSESIPAVITVVDTKYTIDVAFEREALVLSQVAANGEKSGVFKVSKELPTEAKFMLMNVGTGKPDFRFGFEDNAAEEARYLETMLPQECQPVNRTTPGPNWR